MQIDLFCMSSLGCTVRTRIVHIGGYLQPSRVRRV